MDAMRSLPLTELTGRADAEQRFAAVEPDPTVRGFLLQNLRRHGDTWAWQANLDLLAADAARGTDSRIADFPQTGAPAYGGPVLWLVGGDSPYVTPEDGELWDSPNAAVTMAKMAIAAVTGATPKMGDNAEVKL